MVKVAVCVSGAVSANIDNPDFVQCNTVLKSKFPDADFYYATWDSYKDKFESLFPNEQCQYFEEPVVPYHPMVDIKQEDRLSPHFQPVLDLYTSLNVLPWAAHHTKQILCHFWLADRIKNDYDVIVRTRYDVVFYETTRFEPFIKNAVKYQEATGFATPEGELKELRHRTDAEFGAKSFYNTWLYDQVIIHPASWINVDLVNTLHKEARLQAAEFGWYQVLCHPHNSRPVNFNGWVTKLF